ncbi:MAG: fumarylacetoacetate hydrolase family protein [Alphaproteobacteria bacterium]|nr:fumarylacetoacetate hydrolase family protein [Alphaproteobacteria bacterium]
MKLATFSAGGAPEIGVVEDDTIAALSRAAPRLVTGMIDLIARWSVLEAEVRRALVAAPRLSLKDLRLLAPIPRPGKILAIGLNYADHIRETGQEMPARQVWFCKQPTSANGPYDPIVLPRVAERVDYEVEMVAVIGKGGRYIAREDAPAAVFGFCVGNDVSARDWQMATSQWVLGKGFDTHAPFGPWITTSDEVGDPHRFGLRTFVNGEKRQDSNTRHLVFQVWDQVEHVSKVMTLEPGDLIFTGTPGGVGMAMKPPVFLKHGDRVRVEVEELGALEAVCQAER